MPKFSKISEDRLSTCHPDIQKVWREVIKYYDCICICGHRGEQEQNEAFESKKSHLKWPESAHNKFPSMAIDSVPYPLNWKDENQMRVFAGFVLGVATMMGIKLRWGGDWNRDWNVDENKFNDFPHFELA